MKDIGFVCEGGGLRAMYTAGVFDYFLEKNLEVKNIIGVSAGAIYLASYVSKQKGRNLEIQRKYAGDKRFFSIKSLIKTGNFVNSDFAYYQMTKELVPFDFESFMKSDINYKVGVFNCLTGETHYHSKDNYKDIDEVIDSLIASGSLPFLSKEVYKDGIPYLDGGIGSPIPIEESIKDGNKKHFIVLTQGENYEKKPLKFSTLTKIYYKKYSHVSKALINRHIVYNETLEKIKKLEEKGEVFVLRPSSEIKVKRLEEDINKIESLYNLGYEDAKKHYEKILEWIKS